MTDTTSHLSIGEVLTQLQAEFPDVTISKIRFLESQGLIDPERTPSGYRRFYPPDVARLRWILMEQRDNFLPLKVIKERLDANDPSIYDVPPPSPSAVVPARAGAPVEDALVAEIRDFSALAGVETEATEAQVTHIEVTETVTEIEVTEIQVTTEALMPDTGSADEPETVATEPPAARRRVRDLTLPLVLDGDATDGDDGPDTFDRVALAEAAGVTEAALDELESYGVIKPFYDDGIRSFYDRDALVCVLASATLSRHGIEPRHLKMYVHFTDREAALFHQVLAPYLRQRNPVSRARVDTMLVELVTEARSLRGALLRRAIDDALGE